MNFPGHLLCFIVETGYNLHGFVKPIALKTAKTQWSYGRSECSVVKFRGVPVIEIVKVFHG